MGRSKRWKRGGGQPSKEQYFSDEFKDLLEHNFDKSYTYNVPDHDLWSVPQDELFVHKRWQDEQLMGLKETLNGIKSELSHIEINKWHFHTTAMNRAGLIISNIKRQYGPEMCTQAWCKFHEILCSFSLFELDEHTPLNTLHLCEAPGAFIASLNHYIKTRNSYITWNWVANTLNPHYEGNHQSFMIADDSFVMNTLQHWSFGNDNTGDVMSKENLLGLMDNVKATEKFHLVTADGSIDCANNPAEQESNTSQIHYCELVTAMAVLKIGGSLVVKMFTLLEESSISLVYLMCCAFEKVTVFKPVTSKPGNSEVYIVCDRFSGLPEVVMEILIKHTGTERTDLAVLPKNVIPESFLEQHRNCCVQFSNYQIQTIKANQNTFGLERSADDKEKLEMEKQCLGQMFEERCKLRRITNNERIVPFITAGNHHARLAGHNVLRKPHTGSYTERQQDRNLDWEQRVQKMKSFDVDATLYHYPLVLKINRRSMQFECTNWKVQHGKSISKLHSSRFCDATVLNLYNEFLENIDIKDINTSELSTDTEEALRKTVTQEFPLGELTITGDNGSLCEHFQGILSKANLRFKVLDKTKCASKMLYIIDGLCENSESFNNKDHVLKCLETLQVLKKGDCLLWQQGLGLSRMTVGLLYVIHILFKNVQFFVPKNNTSVFYILGLRFCEVEESTHVIDKEATANYSSKNNTDLCTMDIETKTCNFNESDRKFSDIKDYLARVCKTCSSITKDRSEVVEFIPMQNLYEESFYEAICWLNDQLLKRRINHMMNHANSLGVT